MFLHISYFSVQRQLSKWIFVFLITALCLFLVWKCEPLCVFTNKDIFPLPCQIYCKATRQLRNNSEQAQFGGDASSKMAEKLVALTFLLLFVSFQPVISEEAVDQGGKCWGDFLISKNLIKIFLPRRKLTFTRSDTRTEKDTSTSEQTAKDWNEN